MPESKLINPSWVRSTLGDHSSWCLFQAPHMKESGHLKYHNMACESMPLQGVWNLKFSGLPTPIRIPYIHKAIVECLFKHATMIWQKIRMYVPKRSEYTGMMCTKTTLLWRNRHKFQEIEFRVRTSKLHSILGKNLNECQVCVYL